MHLQQKTRTCELNATLTCRQIIASRRLVVGVSIAIHLRDQSSRKPIRHCKSFQAFPDKTDAVHLRQTGKSRHLPCNRECLLLDRREVSCSRGVQLGNTPTGDCKHYSRRAIILRRNRDLKLRPGVVSANTLQPQQMLRCPTIPALTSLSYNPGCPTIPALRFE